MAKPRNTLTVQRTERLSEHFIRVVLGGPGFTGFIPNAFTDCYVKLIFPQDDSESLRAYTIRSVDLVAQEITIDFVYHGDEGIAGPWAGAAQPGDTIDVQGPGGAYAPRNDADWHLFAGDEAALPAIAAALEALPDDAVGEAFLEIVDGADQLDLSHPVGVRLTWLHRGAATPGKILAATVREASWRPGQPHVFIHGEAEAVMKDLRAYIRRDRAVPAEFASISGYWRHGFTDETFRTWKRELAAQESAG